MGIQPLPSHHARCPGAWGEWRSDIKEEPEGRGDTRILEEEGLPPEYLELELTEGVETAGQLAFLQEQGCDEVQGYYYSKPCSAEQFEAYVRGQSKV